MIRFITSARILKVLAVYGLRGRRAFDTQAFEKILLVTIASAKQIWYNEMHLRRP